MAAKEQEEEVPTAPLQVRIPSHTLLGVTGTHHNSSFCVSKTFKILFTYHSQSFCFCTVPDDFMATMALKSSPIKTMLHFQEFWAIAFQLSCVYTEVRHSHSNKHFFCFQSCILLSLLQVKSWGVVGSFSALIFSSNRSLLLVFIFNLRLTAHLSTIDADNSSPFISIQQPLDTRAPLCNQRL